MLYFNSHSRLRVDVGVTPAKALGAEGRSNHVGTTLIESSLGCSPCRALLHLNSEVYPILHIIFAVCLKTLENGSSPHIRAYLFEMRILFTIVAQCLTVPEQVLYLILDSTQSPNLTHSRSLAPPRFCSSWIILLASNHGCFSYALVQTSHCTRSIDSRLLGALVACSALACISRTAFVSAGFLGLLSLVLVTRSR